MTKELFERAEILKRQMRMAESRVEELVFLREKPDRELAGVGLVSEQGGEGVDIPLDSPAFARAVIDLALAESRRQLETIKKEFEDLA